MKTKKLSIFFVLVIILGTLLVLTTTAMAESEMAYIIEDPCIGFTPLPGAQIYCGEVEGFGYQIEIPLNWNGDLLMWAHGYVPEDEPYLWVEEPFFRSWLIENGFAWAASSFSTNGLDVTTGIKDTKTLAIFFQKEIAKPEHIYISGPSSGAQISAISVEQWPNLYDGGLPIASSLAPYEEFDFVWDYYVLSNALAGFEATYPIPTGYFNTNDYTNVKNELALYPGSYPYELNEKGIQFKNALEMRSGGERPLFDQSFLIWYGIAPDYFYFSILELMLGANPIGVKGVWLNNWETVYQLDLDPALSPEEEAFNEIVFRIERDPQAMHPDGLSNMPEPSGKLKAPILSLHGIGDLIAPLMEEQIYAQKVAEHGASKYFVVRAIRELIHGEFTDEEYGTALTDLTIWVETGVKPAGDDILNPNVVRNPYFGCQFTTVDRDYSWIDPSIIILPCP